MKMWKKHTAFLLVLCMILSALAGCGAQQTTNGQTETPELTVTSDILGMADTGNKTTLKVDLIKTGGPGDTNLYYYNEAGERVVYENQEEICVPLDPVTYTGSAVLDLGDVDNDKIDSSNAVVKIAEGSGYYADEYVLSATTLDGEWVDGKYTYILSEGDIEFNTWGYDTSVDYNSNREWSIMGGDGNGVYPINLEVSGIKYDGVEVPAAQFRVYIYCYGRTCTDLALSTEFVPNTYDTSYNSGMAAGDEVKWVWISDNFDALMDDKPYMNDLYTDYFSIVWPKGTDGAAVTADNVKVTLSSAYGEEYVLSTKTAYGEEEYAVFASGDETVVAVTYQQWSFYPVFSKLTIEATNGDMTVYETFDICSVGAFMVQTGGGGVEIDHTLTCYNFYGVEGMTFENSIGDTGYTLSTTIDNTMKYYAEDASGKGYLVDSKDEAWVGDITEYFNIDVRGNCVFVESREVTTEERTVDGTTYTFNQNMNSKSYYNAASAMVEKGATLIDGYNLTNAGVSKWAWTTRYQSGWTTYSDQPTGLPYVDGSYWHGFEVGGSNPAYDEELAVGDEESNDGPSGNGPDGNGPDTDGPDGDATTANVGDFNVQPGVYTYSEVNFANLAIDWTLVLNEDGTYTLSEENSHVGFLTYEGTGWRQVGDTIVCDAMVAGPEHYDWADPVGFCVKINGESFAPSDMDSIVMEDASADSGEITAGVYTYSEVNFANLSIDWTLILNEDGTYSLSEENSHVGYLTYEGTSWEVVDGVVVCAAMVSGPEHYDWADPAGFSVTISGDTFEPVR